MAKIFSDLALDVIEFIRAADRRTVSISTGGKVHVVISGPSDAVRRDVARHAHDIEMRGGVWASIVTHERDADHSEILLAGAQ